MLGKSEEVNPKLVFKVVQIPIIYCFRFSKGV